ncbi:MAG: hypothetical protein RIS37_417, partial [Actinomycetota bacterium]
LVNFTFTASVWEWRGPAPYHFVSVPLEIAQEIKELASAVTYGWGMIPVAGKIGNTSFTTSLWAKNGTYAVPLKDAVRKAEGISLEDTVSVELTLRFR